jgi:hypothetical protein
VTWIMASETSRRCSKSRTRRRDRISHPHAVDVAHNLDDEVEESRLVEKAGAVVGAVGQRMLDPRPTLADRIPDRLGAGAVGNIRHGQVHHQKSAVRVHRDVALAADYLLLGVLTAGLRGRRLDRLAVDDGGRRACLAPGTLAVHHQGHRRGWCGTAAAARSAGTTTSSAGAKIGRHHPPVARTARPVADRVADFLRVQGSLAPAFRAHGQQRLDLAGNLGHPATALSGPDPEFESPCSEPTQSVSNVLLAVVRDCRVGP